MRNKIFTFENFVHENGQKISKHAHKVGENEQHILKIIKIMNFSACTNKSQNFAQSQQHFAPSHNGETVTFRKEGDKNRDMSTFHI